MKDTGETVDFEDVYIILFKLSPPLIEYKIEDALACLLRIAVSETLYTLSNLVFASMT